MKTQSDMEFLLNTAVVQPTSYVILTRHGHLIDRILRRFRQSVGNEKVTSGFVSNILFDPTLGFARVDLGDNKPHPIERLPALLRMASMAGDPTGTFVLAFCDDTPKVTAFLEGAEWLTDVQVIHELDLAPANIDLIVKYFASCETHAKTFDLGDRAFRGFVRSLLETNIGFRELEEEFDFLLFCAFDDDGHFNEPLVRAQVRQGRARLMETFRAFLGTPEQGPTEDFVAELGHLLDIRLSGSEALGELIRITTEVVVKPIIERNAAQSRRLDMNLAVSIWTPLFLARYRDLERALCQDRVEGAAPPLATTSALHRLAIEFGERFGSRETDIAHHGLWNQLRSLARSIRANDSGRANLIRALIGLFMKTLEQGSDGLPEPTKLAVGFAELLSLSAYVEPHYDDQDDEAEEEEQERQNEEERQKEKERKTKEKEEAEKENDETKKGQQ